MLKSDPQGRSIRKKWVFPRHITSRVEFDQFVDVGAIRNFEPETPFLSRDSNLLTIGSCFAQNIAKSLTTRGYNVQRFDIQERLFTPFALCQFCEKIADPDADLSLFEQQWDIDSGAVAAIRTRLRAGPIVIVTLGLSIAWYDTTTDEMIFDPARKTGTSVMYDREGRYEMRQTSVSDNVDAIAGIVNALRGLHPATKVIFTLSPIPLRAAACDNPVLAADAVSKSTLRVALDELMQLRLNGVYYFPSFEILKWFAPMVAQVWYEDEMLIHVRNDWIEYTMSKFRQYYCIAERPISPPIPQFPE